MPAPTKPQLVTANGKDSWWFAPAVASKTAPTALEINAATGLNISCYLFADYEGSAATTDKVTLPRLLCDTTEFEGNGPTKVSLSDIVGAFDPQAASGADGKKAWEKFKAGGLNGFLVRRQGVGAISGGDATVGQFVDVIPVEIGAAVPGKTATDASGVYSFTAPVSVTGSPAWNVAVA